MENLDKVELIREKCGVSYQEAKEALEACDYEVLDAIIFLEQAAEQTQRRAAATQAAPEATEDDVTYELVHTAVAEEASDRQTADQATSTASKTDGAWKRFCTSFRKLINAGMEMSFVAERKGEQVFVIPVLLTIIGLLACGATLWLLIIGLFLGFRYRIEGGNHVASSINEVMDKAADATDSVKESFA